MSEQTQSDVVVDSSPQVEEVIEEVIETPEESEQAEKEAEPEKTEESEAQDDEHSLPNGVKKRIDKITRQKYEAVAEANRLKAELEQMRAQLAPKQKEPQMSDFDTFDDYTEALAEQNTRASVLPPVAFRELRERPLIRLHQPEPITAVAWLLEPFRIKICLTGSYRH